MPDLLNRADAATYISQRVGVPITKDQLAYWAIANIGPRYQLWSASGQPALRGGRGRYALYDKADLDLWITSRLHDPPKLSLVSPTS